MTSPYRPDDGLLLAIFAHPDDESITCGGVLARCKAEGYRTAVLCLTRGAGVPPNPRLAQTRTEEFAAAVAVLGVTSPLVLDFADGYLPWLPAAELEAAIAKAIDDSRPAAVVTFGPDGLYWHPDHVAVFERTTAVVSAMRGGGPALYYATAVPGAIRGLVDAVAARGGRAGHLHVLGITEVDAFGSHAEPPSLVVDVRAYAARKLAALRCHKSQAGTGALALATDEDAVRFLGEEHFRRAPVGSGHLTMLDRMASTVPPARPQET